MQRGRGKGKARGRSVRDDKGKRPLDPIDEQSEELHEEPQSSEANTNDQMTLIMTILVKLVKESNARQEQGSRMEGGNQGVHEEAMDSYLKQFQSLKPQRFKGTEGPVEAEEWLLRVEKTLVGMKCPNDQKVALSTFILDGEVDSWWRSQKIMKFQGRSDAKISWEEFQGAFKNWYIPPSVRRQMHDRFLRLF